MNIIKVFLCLSIFILPEVSLAQRVMYSAQEFRLPTSWTPDVNPDHPFPEYPRPSMKRNEWKSLNGRWHFTKRTKDSTIPAVFEKEIIVPFPVESALSGVYD